MVFIATERELLRSIHQKGAVIVQGLPPIPVVQAGPFFPLETLAHHEARAHALMDCATADVSERTLRMLDAVSRRWLVKQCNALLPEIDAIAERLARPGIYFREL